MKKHNVATLVTFIGLLGLSLSLNGAMAEPSKVKTASADVGRTNCEGVAGIGGTSDSCPTPHQAFVCEPEFGLRFVFNVENGGMQIDVADARNGNPGAHYPFTSSKIEDYVVDSGLDYQHCMSDNCLGPVIPEPAFQRRGWKFEGELEQGNNGIWVAATLIGSPDIHHASATIFRLAGNGIPGATLYENINCAAEKHFVPSSQYRGSPMSLEAVMAKLNAVDNYDYTREITFNDGSCFQEGVEERTQGTIEADGTLTFHTQFPFSEFRGERYCEQYPASHVDSTRRASCVATLNTDSFAHIMQVTCRKKIVCKVSDEEYELFAATDFTMVPERCRVDDDLKIAGKVDYRQLILPQPEGVDLTDEWLASFKAGDKPVHQSHR